MEITYKKVFERIRSVAEEIVNENCKFPTESTFENWDSYSEELEDFKLNNAFEEASEQVSSWDWCIYYGQGFKVYSLLNSSEQDEAESLFYDAGGYDYMSNEKPSLYELACNIIYHWLVQQVCESIDSYCQDMTELCEAKKESL